MSDLICSSVIIFVVRAISRLAADMPSFVTVTRGNLRTLWQQFALTNIRADSQATRLLRFCNFYRAAPRCSVKAIVLVRPHRHRNTRLCETAHGDVFLVGPQALKVVSPVLHHPATVSQTGRT